MSRKKGTKVKKAVEKILNKTTVDEKIVKHVKENRSLYNKILCYTKCYGGYLLAIGAGGAYSTNIWWGLGLTVATAGWAYWATHCNNNAKCKK
tara:strand:- start:341 stop:619 length:279 start_codon:yes stop_codon:yes gene_type:complete